MDLDNFYELAKNAKKASKKLATLSTDIKNKALLSIAEELENHKSQIFLYIITIRKVSQPVQ